MKSSRVPKNAIFIIICFHLISIEKRSCFVEIIPAREIRIRSVHSDDGDSDDFVRVFLGKSTESRTEWQKFDSRLYGFAKGNE